MGVDVKRLILDRTPAREMLVQHFDEACGRLHDLKYKPKAVYLSKADASACGFKALRGARDGGDPPRVRGLPIYGTFAKEQRSKIYCHGGACTTLKPITAKPVKAES